MYKKPLLFFLSMIIFVLPTFAVAAGYSTVEMIGLSDEGRYLAYETVFYDDMSGTGYKKIFFVDVPGNRFINTIVVWDENEEINDANRRKNEVRIRGKVEAALRKYQIIKGNNGTRVFLDTAFTDPLDYQNPGATQRILRDTAFHLEPTATDKRSVRLVLKEFPAQSSNCPQLTFFDLTAKIFELKIYINRIASTLQRDGKLYKSRRCPYAYGINSVYIYKGMIIIYLDSWTSGSEGPNIHKLVVTGRFISS